MAWLELISQLIISLERVHAQAATEPPLAARVGRAAGLMGIALYAGILATLALAGAGCLVLAAIYSTPVALAIIGGVFAEIALLAVCWELRRRSPRPTRPAKANKLPFDVPALAVGGLVTGLLAAMLSSYRSPRSL